MFASKQNTYVARYVSRPCFAFHFSQSDVVRRMHRAPRGIGHTNRLASLLLETPTDGNDYVGGLELFVGFFIIASLQDSSLLILYRII